MYQKEKQPAAGGTFLGRFYISKKRTSEKLFSHNPYTETDIIISHMKPGRAVSGRCQAERTVRHRPARGNIPGVFQHLLVAT